MLIDDQIGKNIIVTQLINALLFSKQTKQYNETYCVIGIIARAMAAYYDMFDNTNYCLGVRPRPLRWVMMTSRMPTFTLT